MDVGLILKTGKKRFFPLFNISWLNSDRTEQHFVAPKKQFKNSYQRNKVKRRLREAFRKQDFAGNIAIVIIAKKTILDASFSDIVQQLEKFKEGFEHV